MEKAARTTKTHPIRGRVVRAALTIGVAASMLSAGLVFAGVSNAGATTPLAFNAGPGGYYTPPTVYLTTPYTYNGAQVTGGSGSYSYAFTYPFFNVLPTGLQLNNDGSISGTDTTDPSGSTFTVIITATDTTTNATVQGDFLLTVDNALTAMSTTEPTTIDPGEALYSWDGDTVTGGTAPITYSEVGTVPDGLTFDPATGTFSGTPAGDVAPEQVTVTATDALGGTESQLYQFTVAAPLAFQSTANPPTIYPGETGFSWDGDAATGGVTPYTYSDGNTTPDGLSFNTSTGEFSGTVSPNATDQQVDVFVTDADGAVIENTYAFIVGSALAIGTGTPPTLTDGAGSYSFSGAEASGGSGTNVYSISTGTLPAGLSLNTTSGLISQLGAAATTAAATTQTFSVTVIDSVGDRSTGQFTITAVPETVAPSGGGGGGGGGGGASSAGSALTPQAVLVLTSTSGVLGTPLTLTSSGGSGSGAVSYAVTTTGSAGCSITSGTLSATSTGNCTVTATKAGDATYAAASSAPTVVTIAAASPAVVLPVNPHAYRVVGRIVVKKNTTVTILGSGFYGQPRVRSNAKGIRTVVSHDTGAKLTVKLFLSALQRKGVHTFTIVLANGKSCKVHYVVVA